MVNRKTTDLYLNKRTWYGIAPEHRVFILLHEYAHCYLDSSDEEEVDELAFAWYIELGYSLTEAVKSLTRILNSNNESHIRRAELQLQRAKKVDNKNNNKIEIDMKRGSDLKGLSLTERLGTSGGFIADTYMESCMGGCPSHAVSLSSLTGCQAGETPKFCLKRMKVEGKEISRINKSEGKRLKGEAEASLGEQGIVKPGWGAQLGHAIKGVGGVVKDVMGKGGDEGGAPPPPKNNTMLYVGIGVAVMVVLGIIVFVVTRK
jgi:hypothetical protein